MNVLPAMNTPSSDPSQIACTCLEQTLRAALETYSNVHRGSGHNSLVTTRLYEQARGIVLKYLGLGRKSHTVIFCSHQRAKRFVGVLKPGSYTILSGLDFGLSLGISALAVRRKSLPRSIQFITGGGTTKLYSANWVIPAAPPERFEAGTPPIINVILFARALLLVKQYGKEVFNGISPEPLTVREILYQDGLTGLSGRELLPELRNTLVGRSLLVPTTAGSSPFINLDNSASTRTFEPVMDAFFKVLLQPPQVRREVVKEVKMVLAEIMGAPAGDYDMIFTSNATESINLAAESLGLEPGDGMESVVLTTILEHSSNDLPWRMVPGGSVVRLSADKKGFFDLGELESILEAYNLNPRFGKKRIRIVAVSGASNVLGTCNDLAAVAGIVHSHGARLLVDASQLVAHRSINMTKLGIDYLAFSAHKVYAPFGCGVLAVKKGLLRFGEEKMKTIRSSGEENAGGIAALGKAMLLLQRVGFDLIAEEEKRLTQKALKEMSGIPGLKLFGIKDPDSPEMDHRVGVILFEMKNKMPGKVAGRLALYKGIGVRYGCHCAHLIIKYLSGFTPFLERFQRIIVLLFPMLKLQGYVRVSLSLENNENDIDRLIDGLRIIAGQPETGTPFRTSGSTTHLSRAQAKRQVEEFASFRTLRGF